VVSLTSMDLQAEPKILSIAPSFDCMLRCEGCYLTTDVSKEMREATKSEYYWERVIQLGRIHGFTEFAMTINPMPNAVDNAISLAKKARKAGYDTINVTWSPHIDLHRMDDLATVVDIISISVDHRRTINSYLRSAYEAGYEDEDLFLASGEKGSLNCHINLNILWTQQLLDKVCGNAKEFIGVIVGGVQRAQIWLDYENKITSKGAFGLGNLDSAQNLLMKPLTHYRSIEEMQQQVTYINQYFPILGNGENVLGDPAYLNLLGINNCPGERMLDIDPMGGIRRCPENPIVFDGSTIKDVEAIMSDISIMGLHCGDKCNCMIG
jgi:hypothetical protein